MHIEVMSWPIGHEHSPLTSHHLERPVYSSDFCRAIELQVEITQTCKPIVVLVAIFVAIAAISNMLAVIMANVIFAEQ